MRRSARRFSVLTQTLSLTAMVLAGIPASMGVGSAQCNDTGSISGCEIVEDGSIPFPDSDMPDPPSHTDGQGAPELPNQSVWKQTFFDDFSRTSVGENWPAYTGRPGGNPDSMWSIEQVGISDGALRLSAERTPNGWLTGGTMDTNHPQLYGNWQVRMRADRSHDISYHVLLWPENEIWPPELDIAESVDPQRSTMSAFVHWQDEQGRKKREYSTAGDFDKWHTVSVEWRPKLIVWKLDGREFARETDRNVIPHTPMRLAIQSESGACERRLDWGMEPCPTVRPQGGTALEIDWVRVSALR